MGLLMKVPFRQQVTGFDCVPTTFINALTYLFDCNDIPPFVVRRIYKECLDMDASRGTSSRAIKDLGFWLNNYTERGFRKFNLKARYINGEDVHLGRNSRIIRCIKSNGATIMNVYMGHNEWHCILGMRVEGRWLHCFDPYPRTRRYIKSDAVQFVETSRKHEPNLKIHFNWLEKDIEKEKHLNGRKFVFGSIDDRECLLLNRIEI